MSHCYNLSKQTFSLSEGMWPLAGHNKGQWADTHSVSQIKHLNTHMQRTQPCEVDQSAKDRGGTAGWGFWRLRLSTAWLINDRLLQTDGLLVSQTQTLMAKKKKNLRKPDQWSVYIYTGYKLPIVCHYSTGRQLWNQVTALFHCF